MACSADLLLIVVTRLSIPFPAAVSRAAAPTYRRVYDFPSSVSPAEVVRAREKARRLGIVDSDGEDDVIHNAHLRINEEYSTQRTKRRRVESELQRYYEEGLESDTVNNPLRWWIKRSDDHGNPYPVLTRMAMDLFSVPAMSSECERVFSETKRLITDD
jgi:hypothetical protein